MWSNVEKKIRHIFYSSALLLDNSPVSYKMLFYSNPMRDPQSIAKLIDL